MQDAEPGQPRNRQISFVRRNWRGMPRQFVGSAFVRDPISRTASVAIRHRTVLSWFVAVGLVALVAFNRTRWEAVVTVWGILGVGLVVSLVLEERSESVEHTAWLRRNRYQIKPFLDSIHSRSALLAAASVGIPTETLQALTGGASLGIRQEAIASAAHMVDSFAIGASPAPPERPFAAGAKWASHLNSWSSSVDSQLQHNQAILPRLVEVSSALSSMRFAVGLGAAIASGSVPFIEPARFESATRVQVARGALQVCAACTVLLHHAGLLES